MMTVAELEEHAGLANLTAASLTAAGLQVTGSDTAGADGSRLVIACHAAQYVLMVSASAELHCSPFAAEAADPHRVADLAPPSGPVSRVQASATPTPLPAARSHPRGWSVWTSRPGLPGRPQRLPGRLLLRRDG